MTNSGNGVCLSIYRETKCQVIIQCSVLVQVKCQWGKEDANCPSNGDVLFTNTVG